MRYLAIAAAVFLAGCHGVGLEFGVGRWKDTGRSGTATANHMGEWDTANTTNVDGDGGHLTGAWVNLIFQLTPQSMRIVERSDSRGEGLFHSYEQWNPITPDLLDTIDQHDDPKPPTIEEHVAVVSTELKGLSQQLADRMEAWQTLEQQRQLEMQELRNEIKTLTANALTWEKVLGIGTATGMGGGGLGYILYRALSGRRREDDPAPTGPGASNEELSA